MSFSPSKLALDFGISEDEVRARWLALRVAQWKADFKKFARDVVKIRTKSGELEPLKLNSAQEILHAAAEEMLSEESWVRLAGMKGRRQGFSTYVAARGYWRAILWNRQTYTFCHMK
jgi:acyl-CoA thioesterase FadM